MLRWLWRLFLLAAALTCLSFVGFMSTWSEPDMTQKHPSNPPFARCEGPDCLSTHPDYKEWNN